MILQGEHYDLVVGNPLSHFKTIRFIFEGWTDEEERKKYMGSIDWFEVESYAGRVLPQVPATRAIFKLVCREGANPVRDGINVPAIGTPCDITYFHELATPEEIRAYFAAHGIAMRPAEPFFKPQKSMTWMQYLKWKIFRKGFPGKDRFPSVIA